MQEADIHDRFVFEEAVWLLLFGSLPDEALLNRFRKLLESHRELPRGFADDMILNSPSPNIMNKMARSVLAMYSYDEHAEDTSLPNILRQSINLIAELPTMMVYAYPDQAPCVRPQQHVLPSAHPGQSTAEHILSTYRPDQKFTHEEAKLLEVSACWSMPTTAAATAPPSPAVCCPPPAPIHTRPSRRPSAR